MRFLLAIVSAGVLLAQTPGTVTFNGGSSDLNNCTIGGRYTGTLPVLTYCVRVDSTGAADTVSWGTGSSCTSGGSGVAIAGNWSAQSLSNGITFQCAAATGHTLNNAWVMRPSNVTPAEAKTWVDDGQSVSTSSPRNVAVGTAAPVGAPAGTIAGSVIYAASGALNVKAFGAVGDGQVVIDASISSGSSTVHSSAATFTSSDVGKLVDVNGAGAANCGARYLSASAKFNCNLAGTIVSVVDPHTVTVSVPAGSTVANAQLKWCADDTVALRRAFTQLQSATGQGTLYFPRGNYCTSSGLTYSLANKTLEGDGKWGSAIWNMGVVAYNSTTFYHLLLVDNGTHGLSIRHLGFEGTNRNGELGSGLGVPSADGVYMCSGAPGAFGFCNSQSGLTDITIEDCRFDHFWGIGLHAAGTGTVAGQQLNNLVITASAAQYNSYDGFNPNVYDGLIFTGNSSMYNGTGGLETTAYGSQVITGNYFAHNKNAGVAVGGMGNPGAGAAAVVTGNSAYSNGWYADDGGGIGTGIVITSNQLSATVSGNAVKYNFLGGISTGNGGFGTLGKFTTISGNDVCCNGTLPQAGGSLPFGIYVNSDSVGVWGNHIYNDPSQQTVSAGGAWVSGGTGCTNGTQTVTFTNGGGTGATGTIQVASGVPTGPVTVTNGGSGYVTVPTTGTVSTCTGTSTFSGVTITGFNEQIGVNVDAVKNPNIGANSVGPHSYATYSVASGVSGCVVTDPNNMAAAKGLNYCSIPAWPTATALAAIPATCASGQLARGVDSNGNAIGCTSNAATATAFAATPTTCPAGQSASGVDASGNATGCTSVTGSSIVSAPAGTSDVLCAKGADSTVFLSGTLNTVTVTTGTDSGLPASGTWTTTGGGGTGATGTFTATGGNLASITITNGGQNYTANPAMVLSGGTLGSSTAAFSACKNSTDATGGLYMATTWMQPANYWSTGKAVNVIGQWRLLSSSSPPTITRFNHVEDFTGNISSVSGFGVTGSVNGYGFTTSALLSAPATGSLNTFPMYYGIPGESPFNTANASSTPTSLDFSSSHTLSYNVRWGANTAGNALWLQSIIIR